MTPSLSTEFRAYSRPAPERLQLPPSRVKHHSRSSAYTSSGWPVGQAVPPPTSAATGHTDSSRSDTGWLATGGGAEALGMERREPNEAPRVKIVPAAKPTSARGPRPAVAIMELAHRPNDQGPHASPGEDREKATLRTCACMHATQGSHAAPPPPLQTSPERNASSYIGHYCNAASGCPDRRQKGARRLSSYAQQADVGRRYWTATASATATATADQRGALSPMTLRRTSLPSKVAAGTSVDRYRASSTSMSTSSKPPLKSLVDAQVSQRDGVTLPSTAFTLHAKPGVRATTTVVVVAAAASSMAGPTTPLKRGTISSSTHRSWPITSLRRATWSWHGQGGYLQESDGRRSIPIRRLRLQPPPPLLLRCQRMERGEDGAWATRRDAATVAVNVDGVPASTRRRRYQTASAEPRPGRVASVQAAPWSRNPNLPTPRAVTRQAGEPLAGFHRDDDGDGDKGTHDGVWNRAHGSHGRLHTAWVRGRMSAAEAPPFPRLSVVSTQPRLAGASPGSTSSNPGESERGGGRLFERRRHRRLGLAAAVVSQLPVSSQPSSRRSRRLVAAVVSSQPSSRRSRRLVAAALRHPHPTSGPPRPPLLSISRQPSAPSSPRLSGFHRPQLGVARTRPRPRTRTRTKTRTSFGPRFACTAILDDVPGGAWQGEERPSPRQAKPIEWRLGSRCSERPTIDGTSGASGAKGRRFCSTSSSSI
ncbi:uncharacterized protein PSFLO_02530 [Pseudozyma flocculosa]|uniref:Uncharacterized protein n=1 Tax=Pseudozyma flocculosa TaxID=84751 RepID=A0A5C3EXV4_9BASI|nr:uncharacterized protein PSFLO_02530 [Pseudozyma flocculosa]